MDDTSQTQSQRLGQRALYAADKNSFPQKWIYYGLMSYLNIYSIERPSFSFSYLTSANAFEMQISNIIYQ